MQPTNHPPDEQPIAGNDPPSLIIDWGVKPQAGNHLSPQFHLIAPGYRLRPRITATLDRALDQGDWNSNPGLTERGESHWSFHQSLDLTRDGQVCRFGQYLLKLHVVFPEAGPGGIRCYRAEVRITVPDAAASTSPVLEIRGTGSTLLNLQGIDINRYAKIVVEGSEQSVVNMLHVDGPGTVGQPSVPPQSPPDERLILRLPLEPDRELQQLIPFCSVPRRAPPTEPASLVFEDGRRIHLFARQSVVLGRDVSGGTPSDIMLQLLPLDDDRWQLTRLISRQHLRLTLSADGLRLEDCGSAFGTYLVGQRLTAPATLSAPAYWWPQPHAIDVAGVLGLDLTLHHDPSWDDWERCCSGTAESYYAVAAGCHIPPAWQLARDSRIDAVRVCRRAPLPVAGYLERIKHILIPGYSGQWDTVSQAAAAIEPTDQMTDREQYVVVYRTATIGSSDRVAIALPGVELPGATARIVQLGGGFWLDSGADDGVICVDGRALARRELVPLTPGNRLRIGSAELTFAPFAQLRS